MRCNFTHGLYNPLEKHLVALQMEILILDVDFRSSSHHAHFNQNNYHRALGRMIFQWKTLENTGKHALIKAERSYRVFREAGCPRNSETAGSVTVYKMSDPKVRSNSRESRRELHGEMDSLNVKCVDLRGGIQHAGEKDCRVTVLLCSAYSRTGGYSFFIAVTQDIFTSSLCFKASVDL